MKKFEFDARSFRMLPSPYSDSEIGKSPTTYEAYVEIQDLPNDFPMKTNPREQNLNTKVSKAIRESVNTLDETFHIKNRGIVLSAKSVSYDQKSKRMSIEMDNEEVHGNIDGGHTYKIILEERDKIEKEQYVKLEIIVNAEDFFTDLAGARNTSVQVQDKAIAELEKKFDPIKAFLPKYICENIAFKQNETKRISVETILSIFTCFDISKYNGVDNQPISSYTQKSSCINSYIKYFDEDEKNGTTNNPYIKMGPIAEKILMLYDRIEKNYPKYYKAAYQGGKFGALKGIGYKAGKKFKTELYDEETDYSIPKGLILPILSSFRSLIVEKNGEYQWRDGVEPFDYLDKYGEQLVRYTMERYKTLSSNPNALGKDAGHWRELYTFMLSQYKDELLKQQGFDI